MLDELGDLGLSRRHVLSGVAVLGAVGFVAPMPAALRTHRETHRETAAEDNATPPAPVKVDDNNGHRTPFTLHGLFSTIVSPDAGPPTTTADLVDGHGAPRGSFWSAALAAGPMVLLFHTFELGDGSIHGQGSGPLDEATFAVVGGTGAYRGARGQYVARQRPVSAGGNGSAEFVFDLIPGKE